MLLDRSLLPRVFGTTNSVHLTTIGSNVRSGGEEEEWEGERKRLEEEKKKRRKRTEGVTGGGENLVVFYSY